MIRPTTRAVLVFVCGIPFSLLVVIYDSSLWALSLDYAALALVTIGLDALLAFPPRQLNVHVAMPDKLYIGERGSISLTIAAARFRRATRFELIARGQRGDIEPAEIVSGDLATGQQPKSRCRRATTPRPCAR